MGRITGNPTGRPLSFKSAVLREQCSIAASREADCCFDKRPKVSINNISMNASRYVWILAYSDPGELHVLHTCNNDWCINPKHLYLGDHQDNMNDLVKAGHPSIGEGSAHSVLTWNDVASIRDMRSAERTYQEIADHFQVGLTTIHDIIKK